jgi:hypothetical protein
MRLKLVSYFLLLLFSIVIAFPGYSAGTASSKNEKPACVIKSKTTPVFSWKLMLKKCLSKGINMIEEERNVEEDEDTSCKEVCYIISVQQVIDPVEKVLFNSCNMEEHGLMNMRSVPYPPPNFC